MLQELQKNNPDLTILTATQKNKLFCKLNIDTSELVAYSTGVTVGEENTYIPSDAAVETLTVVKNIAREVFAEAKIQAGWCCGGGTTMNGMEWHKSSEVVIACTEMLLLIGDFFDIENDVYDSSKALALYLQKGEAVELFPMTLHLAPLKVSELFKAAIILPEGTNMSLKNGINGSLRAVNKWLLVHKDNRKGILSGGRIGISGKNIKII